MIVEKAFPVPGGEGLHCRVAVQLLEVLRDLDAAVSLQCGDRRADCRSIVDMLALGCGPGCHLVVRAEGRDAAAAVAAVERLLTDGCE